MGRPSKKAERLEQVLDAFYRCIAKYGLEGSTLEKIAAESGLQRSLVRHFAGNRDDLVLQLANKVVNQSDQEWKAFLGNLPDTDAVPTFLDYLFAGEYSDPEFVLVVSALIFSAGTNNDLHKLMKSWLDDFVQDTTVLIRRDYPDASQKNIDAVSFGIISLYFNLDSLTPLSIPSEYRASARHAADILLKGLD